MDPRSRANRPPRKPSAPRDYRTLTMPTVSRPTDGPRGHGAGAPEVPDAYGRYGTYGAYDEMADRLPDERGWDDQREWDEAGQGQPTRASRALVRRPADGANSAGDSDARQTQLVPKSRRHATSVALPATGGVLVRGAKRPQPAASGKRLSRSTHHLPIRLAGSLAILLVIGTTLAAPRVTAIASDSTCGWYTVKPGDTLANIGASHQANVALLARANHISVSSTIYVGQRLCMPTAWWSQAKLAPAVPSGAEVALPPGIMAGEPCTEDRAIVWTVPVSRWAIPPGCFAKIYYPDPRDYMVNGQVIGGFGWCNWWPEALLRNPRALDAPEHLQPRVGVPVFYIPINAHIGHYAFVESIGPNGWILISEMNMYWRGAGWAKVNYRYMPEYPPDARYLYY